MVTDMRTYAPYEADKRIPDSYSDEQWVKDIREGNHRAFEKLFHVYYKDLVVFANAYVQKPEVAEELVQELFFNIWKGRQKWSPRGKLRAYLFGAARNNSLKYLKRQSMVSRIRLHMLSWIIEETESPDDAIEYEEFNQAVQRAIDALPEKRRLIFTLSRRQGLSYAEIAAVLGISVNTVENQMVRAMKYLRHRLSAFHNTRVS